MSHGATTFQDLYERAAEQVAKILRGTPPSELPLREATPVAARARGRGDRMSAPGKAGAILPVEVRPK